ncbi:hypothetical protein SNEBB_007151 [Seison nebaliae]|nr:hypothetical protein SNEBB_007151 [Seison nebaliae]
MYRNLKISSINLIVIGNLDKSNFLYLLKINSSDTMFNYFKHLIFLFLISQVFSEIQQTSNLSKLVNEEKPTNSSIHSQPNDIVGNIEDKKHITITNKSDENNNYQHLPVTEVIQIEPVSISEDISIDDKHTIRTTTTRYEAEKDKKNRMKKKMFGHEEWLRFTTVLCMEKECPKDQECRLNKDGEPICITGEHFGYCFPAPQVWFLDGKVGNRSNEETYCTYDSECQLSQKCCMMPDMTMSLDKDSLFDDCFQSNELLYRLKSTKRCIRACPHVGIDFSKNECEFGYEKDELGCPLNKCFDPCQGIKCPDGFECSYETVQQYTKRHDLVVKQIQEHLFGVPTKTEQNENCKKFSSVDLFKKNIHNIFKTFSSTMGKCARVKKPGSCPTPFLPITPMTTTYSFCEKKIACLDDFHCPQTDKCCYNHPCGKICMAAE